MEYYNVHLVWPDGVKEKVLMALDPKLQLTKDQMAEATPTIANSLRAGATIRKYVKIGVRESTSKQKIAHQYRSCIGAAMMLDKALQNVANLKFAESLTPQQITRIMNALALALTQVTKAKRDVRDLFRLMGLDIK